MHRLFLPCVVFALCWLPITTLVAEDIWARVTYYDEVADTYYYMIGMIDGAVVGAGDSGEFVAIRNTCLWHDEEAMILVHTNEDHVAGMCFPMRSIISIIVYQPDFMDRVTWLEDTDEEAAAEADTDSPADANSEPVDEMP